MAQHDDWNMRIARRVGREVARAREGSVDERGRKLSAQTLADRCAALGHPLDRSVIAKLEKGIRQTVSVADLLVLAKALDLPPLALVFPVGYEEETEVLPERLEHPVTGLRWASGEGVLPPHQGDKEQNVASRWCSTAVFWIRKLLKDEETIRYNKQRARDHWLRVATADSPEARQAYEQMARTADEQVAGQEAVVARWRRELEEKQGILAETPPLHGEVPGNLLSSPGGDKSPW
ncbi:MULTISPECIES: helix-turn-helix domain-containing protein [unclassified Streptomyces]|uniref:helix-turn-helix domain-containing protein n=1 Tax=unclassified Streptomyces TaxID=2593676 RepID=UPI003808C0B2